MIDEKPLEGTLVPTPTLKVGGHVFVPVVFGKGADVKLHKLSQREAKFVKKLLDTGSLEHAALEIGVSLEAGKRYAKRPAIQRYLYDMLEQRALASGLTIEKLLAKVHEQIEGRVTLTEAQMEGIKVAARLLRPTSPALSLTVNQQNNNFSGPSPYAGLTVDEIRTALVKRGEDLSALR